MDIIWEVYHEGLCFAGQDGTWLGIVRGQGGPFYYNSYYGPPWKGWNGAEHVRTGASLSSFSFSFCKTQERFDALVFCPLYLLFLLCGKSCWISSLLGGDISSLSRFQIY